MSKPFVAILMGSDSDFPVMQTTLDVLKGFDISYEVKVTSAHRTPAATHAYVTVITSYSIHYTKLYEGTSACSAWRRYPAPHPSA